MLKTAGDIYRKNVVVGDTNIRVTIRIPEYTRNKQAKINQIYNILKPSKSA